jgi:hypothetical protein
VAANFHVDHWHRSLHVDCIVIIPTNVSFPLNSIARCCWKWWALLRQQFSVLQWVLTQMYHC